LGALANFLHQNSKEGKNIMSATVICPSCNEENSGSSLHCTKCQTSLIGIPRQTKPLTELEVAAQQKEVMKNKIALVEEKVKTESLFKGGAANFYWIAGLSIINSFILLVGGNWSFFIGLGITQLIDSIARTVAQDVGGNAATIIQIVAFIIDIFIASIFIVFGIFARKQQKWAFIVGMVLYTLDGLIFLIVPYFLAIGFHLFILYGLYIGLKSIKKYNEVQQQISA
jgi:hypothetical protein